MTPRYIGLATLLVACASEQAPASNSLNLTRGFPALDDLTMLMDQLPGSEELPGKVSEWCEAGPELAIRARSVQRSATSSYSAEAEELLGASERLRDECASKPETELIPRIEFMLDRLARIRKHSGHSDPR